MSSIKKKFGQSVYRLRQGRGLSQMELAARADLHLNSVNRIEAGEKDVQLETIEKLAKGLDCKMSDIFSVVEKQK